MQRREHLIIALESLLMKALAGNEGRSNQRTALLHGALEKYIDSLCPRKVKRWKHEESIEGNGQKFNLDMYSELPKHNVAVLLKCLVRSIGKNKKNNLVNAWGEAIRTAYIAEGFPKDLRILSIVFHSTKDIVISGRGTQGGGSVTIKPYKHDPQDVYNAGLKLIKDNKARHLYVSIPYEYTVAPTLKSLSAVRGAFKAVESGKRVIIKEADWDNLDAGIKWLLDLEPDS